MAEVRINADRIYKDISEEYNSASDINRQLQPDWVTEARDYIVSQQKMVIEDLEEKVAQAPEEASDEFMYQDKTEAQKELDVARKILQIGRASCRKRVE